MLKKLFLSFFIAILAVNAFSQSSATSILLDDKPIESTISELKKLVKEGATNTEKYDASLLLAQIQEQFGEYTDASLYYTTAASLIGTQTAKGQEHLLGAARCALLIGDVSRADFLLSTALTSLTDAEAKARANLYAVWSWIIKAENEEELNGPIAVLKSYVVADTMKAVRPSLLLTLYHLTGEKGWANELIESYPNSPETAIANDEAQLFPSPFWYFSSIKN